MMYPAAVDLYGDRWTPFSQSMVFINLNLTGAVFLMHVRATRDITGSPLVSLANTSTPGAQGVRLVSVSTDTIANHITAERMTVDQIPDSKELSDVISISTIHVVVSEASMEGMPFPTPRGPDVTLYYDLHITPSGQIKQVWARAKFIVRAGATQ